MFKTYFIRWWTVVIVLMGVNPTPVSAYLHDLKLELLMQRFEPASQKILVRFVATNTGQQPLTLPRLTAEHWQDHLGWWGGWELSASRCFPRGGSSGLRHPEPRKEELMTLAPGEQFSVTFNLALLLSRQGTFVRKGGEFEKFVFAHAFPLSIPDGEYTVRARFFWDGQEMARSESLTVTILQNPRRMYFPGDATCLISPDERHRVINVMGDRNDPSSAGALYLRDLRSGKEEHIYTYKKRVEVLWSPEGNNILINNYKCTRGDGYYPPFSLIFNTTLRLYPLVASAARWNRPTGVQRRLCTPVCPRAAASITF